MLQTYFLAHYFMQILPDSTRFLQSCSDKKHPTCNDEYRRIHTRRCLGFKSIVCQMLLNIVDICRRSIRINWAPAIVLSSSLRFVRLTERSQSGSNVDPSLKLCQLECELCIAQHRPESETLELTLRPFQKNLSEINFFE